MLMDMFYDSVSIDRKLRRHFHPFMLDVHQRLHQLRMSGKREEMLSTIADEIATNEARLLCLDEFQVTDVADAMILRVLFEELFDRGTVLVATSNRKPQDLYLGGINREVFLPFIDLLQERCEILAVQEGPDHRLLGTLAVGAYHHPLGDKARQALDQAFANLADGGAVQHVKCQVMMGRTLDVPRAVPGRVARFSFDELCLQAYGAADYLALAQQFPALILDDVPIMYFNERDKIRKFIVLLDVLYEHGVRFVCSAAAPPEQLFQQPLPDRDFNGGHKDQALQFVENTSDPAYQATPPSFSQLMEGVREDEKFASSRAVSRLVEMASEEYLHATDDKRRRALDNPNKKTAA